MLNLKRGPHKTHHQLNGTMVKKMKKEKEKEEKSQQKKPLHLGRDVIISFIMADRTHLLQDWKSCTA